MIVTIDGVAGAGKTTLAKFMEEEIRGRASVQVVHMDNLYDGWEDPLGGALSHKLKLIVRAHSQSRPHETSIYDWERSSAGATLTILPVDLLILEGVGAGQRSIREFVERKIWIEIEPSHGLQRVLKRDGSSIEKEMMRFVEQQRIHFLEEGTRAAADVHLNAVT